MTARAAENEPTRITLKINLIGHSVVDNKRCLPQSLFVVSAVLKKRTRRTVDWAKERERERDGRARTTGIEGDILVAVRIDLSSFRLWCLKVTKAERGRERERWTERSGEEETEVEKEIRE